MFFQLTLGFIFHLFFPPLDRNLLEAEEVRDSSFDSNKMKFSYSRGHPTLPYQPLTTFFQNIRKLQGLVDPKGPKQNTKNTKNQKLLDNFVPGNNSWGVQEPNTPPERWASLFHASLGLNFPLLLLFLSINSAAI